MQALLAYDWPGNIRELRNTIERATVLADGEVVTIHDLPDKFRTLDVEGVSTSSLRQALDTFERDYIRRSLAENKGNKETTAGKLGVDLATLYRKLKKLRIEAETMLCSGLRMMTRKRQDRRLPGSHGAKVVVHCLYGDIEDHGHPFFSLI